ncbi:MAG: hypothetical protein GF331_17790 [Chitinivibrionales bacterium]|nr:hypothetical protein [Chitinivibrionales bacterium]
MPGCTVVGCGAGPEYSAVHRHASTFGRRAAEGETYVSTRELIRAISEFFNRERVPYAIIGAFALYGYGYVRATKDIDFLTERKHQGAVVGFLEGLGFETTHCSDAFSNHLHPVGAVRVDVMYVEGSTAQRMLSSTRPAIVSGGTTVRVVSPEHLIALKLFAAHGNPSRRLRDLADVKEIVSRCGVRREDVWRYFERYGLEEYDDDIFGQ